MTKKENKEFERVNISLICVNSLDLYLDLELEKALKHLKKAKEKEDHELEAFYSGVIVAYNQVKQYLGTRKD